MNKDYSKTCPICDSPDLSNEETNHKFPVNSPNGTEEIISTILPYYRCNHCHFEYTTPEQDQVQHDAAVQYYKESGQKAVVEYLESHGLKCDVE